MRLQPASAVEIYNQVNNAQGTGRSGKSMATGARNSVGAVGASLGASGGPATNGQQGGIPANKLVPLDQRVSALEEQFDDKALKKMGAVECVTCASRTYQDGSNDPGVSFKAPTHLSPGQAASAVMSHEMEHVSHEQANAESEGREVINQSVQIFRDTCPECGTNYVSGGLTTTTTAGKRQSAYEGASKANSEGHLVDYRL